MKQDSALLISILIFGIGLARDGQAQCSLSVEKPDACVRTSIAVTVNCRNENQEALEWLVTEDPRAKWELTRPNGQIETAFSSRYPVAPDLVILAPGEEVSFNFPLTRWFALSAAGFYRLRFTLAAVPGSAQIESNEVSFTVMPCSADIVLSACRALLKNPRNVEMIGGFEDEAAIPCLGEALALGSVQSASVIKALARSNEETAVAYLVEYYHSSGAFDRLAVWNALREVDTSALSAQLRETIGKILREQPISLKNSAE